MTPDPPNPSRARNRIALKVANLGLASLGVCLVVLCTGVRLLAAELAPLSIQDLDAERSRGDFEVRVLWLVGVHGRFGKVHGTVAIDREHGTVVADARIDVDTLTMRSAP